MLDASNGSLIGSPWTGLPSTLGITAGKDSAGNNIILVSEDTSNKIAVYSTTGTLKCTITVPSTGTAPNIKPALPRDAATDAAGNVYVAAYQQDRMDMFAPVVGNTCPTAMTSTWGTSGNGALQFKRPYGVATDGSGHVFVADSDNERIQEFNSTGSTLIATFGAGPPTAGDFQQLRRVAVANGQVYGADLWGLHIDRFTAPGPTPAQTYPATFGAPPAGFVQRALGLTFDRQRQPVRGRQRQPAHPAVQAGRERRDLVERRHVGRPRLGRQRPQRLQLAARHQLRARPTVTPHAVGGRHQEQPPARVQDRRHLHRQPQSRWAAR